MKKKFLFSCLAFVIALSGLGLVACGDENSSINPFEKYMDSVTTYKSATTLFKHSVTDGIESDFYLNNFTYKEESGEKVEGSRYYITLIAYGMDYIEDYYVYLAGSEGKDYSALHENLDALNESFNEINQSSKDMVNDEGISDKHNQTYNAHFAMYEANAKNFINNLYETALSLSDFLIQQEGFIDELGTSSTNTQEEIQIQFYMDSQILKVFDDIRRVVIVSSNGVNYQGQGVDVFDNAISLLSSFANLSTRYIRDLNNETIENTMNICNRLDGERNMVRKALDNFSITDYVEDDMEIDVYEVENENAWAYYNRMEMYFSSNINFLTEYYNYLQNNIYE